MWNGTNRTAPVGCESPAGASHPPALPGDDHVDRTDQEPQQPTPALAAYGQAAQDCRDIAQQVGVRSCDADPDWKAAEWRANDLFDKAVTAGHSYDEVLKAGRKK